MTSSQIAVLQGTLELLTLRALQGNQPMHGYAILGWLRRVTQQELIVEDAALYPALHRMEARGLIQSRWGRSENNRRAKFYSLTDKGRKALRDEAEIWRRYVGMMDRVLEADQGA
jgi:transcriptional regulator